MINDIDLYDSLTSTDAVELPNDAALLRLKDYESLGEHNKQYSDILKTYTVHVDKTLNFKRTMKQVFFWGAIGVMALCVLLVIACGIVIAINANDEDFNIQDYIIPALTALSSFLTVFIIIPKIIAEYLFNSDEDEVMKSIVSSIQDYDKYIRGDLHNSSDKL